MEDGHCFISYSVADGLEFATRLFNELEGGHPHLDAWFDKICLRPGDDWDKQIANAISDCKCLLFVMSSDSVTEGSNCKHEWAWALKYKKLVIPLLIDKKAQLPFRLGSLQYIDFTSGFDAGIAKLRKRIGLLNSPEGVLQELKDRLLDAERDLSRASSEDKPRFQAEIEKLSKKIEIQKRFLTQSSRIETNSIEERKRTEISYQDLHHSGAYKYWNKWWKYHIQEVLDEFNSVIFNGKGRIREGVSTESLYLLLETSSGCLYIFPISGNSVALRLLKHKPEKVNPALIDMLHQEEDENFVGGFQVDVDVDDSLLDGEVFRIGMTIALQRIYRDVWQDLLIKA